ncbi:ATP-dependent caseinolytic (Clp) protease/crotonase family protein [Actinidia rufa]|uniref:ATP-dependent caseinolytic (Clp) protease/crotonase family protein n=1 Tax=Actinidia rufa TaxID=165716 RepID=A0A7J0H0I7_9ERIC|nr:ATP-dependent caseinolytic (Clp) protease/crotonase family protein [Actinidia rufa]
MSNFKTWGFASSHSTRNDSEITPSSTFKTLARSLPQSLLRSATVAAVKMRGARRSVAEAVVRIWCLWFFRIRVGDGGVVLNTLADGTPTFRRVPQNGYSLAHRSSLRGEFETIFLSFSIRIQFPGNVAVSEPSFYSPLPNALSSADSPIPIPIPACRQKWHGKDMLRGLQLSFEAINRDSSANILMICSSVPKVFCAGADLKEWKTMSPSEVQAFVNSLRSPFSYLEALCIPTIAVIEGAALGGGLEMVFTLKTSGEDTVLGLPETGLAIIPGAGGTQRFPRLVGRSVAKELIFTGRKIVGRDAVLMGLVNHCFPAGEGHLKALEIAREINQKGPLALRMAKQAIDEGLQTDMTSTLELEEECYEELLNTKDRLEGLLAFAEKQKPKYTGE